MIKGQRMKLRIPNMGSEMMRQIRVKKVYSLKD